MARGAGFGSFIGFGRESVLGTTVARTVFTSYLKEGSKLEQPYQEGGEFRSSSIPRTTRVANRKSTAPVDFTLSYTGLEVLLKDLFGAVNTTTLGGGAKQHDFSLTDSLPSPGLSVELQKMGGVFLFADCKVNKATFRFEPTKEATVQFEIVGLEESNPSASTPTYAVIRPVLCDQISVLTFDGSVIDLDSLEISFDNLLVSVPKLRSLVGREYLRNDSRKITGKMVKDFEDIAALSPYDKFKTGTLAALVVTATDGVAAGADNFKFTLSLPTIQCQGPTPMIDGPGIRKQNIDFQAVQNAAAGNDEATAQLINTTTSVI